MRKQDFQENDAMSLKREQLAQKAELKKEQLQQEMEAAKLRSQDARYTADQRREAASEATAMRGQIAQLMAEMRRLGIEAKNSASGDAKPKGLTREAGLKWELDNGKIDQATYDAAISASPGGVLRQKQTDAMNTSETGFAAVERNVDQLYDQKNKSLKPAAKSLFGQYAQYRPESTMSQESVDAKLALEGLTDQVMMTNLAEAKARVGQSFGSMQVQEWDKFTQQLTSLKRGLSEEQAATSMANVLDFVKNKRAVLKKALNTDNVIQADRKPAPVAPSDFNARWASLPSGQSLVGPDGKTYTKK